MALHMRCANAENMDSYMPLVGIPSILTAEPEQDDGRGPVYYFATLQQVIAQAYVDYARVQ